MDLIRTIEQAETIRSIGLRKEVLAAIERGEQVRRWDGRHQTIILEGGRAGQETEGDPAWGEWDEEARVIRLDERDEQGRALTLDLGGHEALAE